jgi:hypothetical protein
MRRLEDGRLNRGSGTLTVMTVVVRFLTYIELIVK